MAQSAVKKILINTLKFGASFAFIAWLIYSAHAKDPDTFQRFIDEPKGWGRLGVAAALYFTAVQFTFVRWYFLVTALELPFRIRDAIRLGFLGFFCNLIALGAVGGDIFKAFAIAKHHKNRRAEAVATVVIDRIIGLYALFIVASTVIVATQLYDSPDSSIRTVCYFTLACTGTGFLGILMILIPGITTGKASEFLGKLPKIGTICSKLLNAVRMYRMRFPIVILAGVMSICVHSLIAASIFMISRGLPGAAPEMIEQFVAVPLSLLTGVLPLPAAGFGAFEFALDKMYVLFSTDAHVITEGKGLLTALTYRLFTLAIAFIGACYYFSSRSEIEKTMEEAAEETESS